MADSDYPWSHHPDRQIREIVAMPGGGRMERMYFPEAPFPVYSYRRVREQVLDTELQLPPSDACSVGSDD